MPGQLRVEELTSAASFEPAPAASDGWVPARGGVSKDEQTRRTRKLVVDAGIRCLAKFGYARTTMLAISEEAGLSRGPLQYHFADRNSLMAAVAEAIPLIVATEILERTQKAKSIQERLDAIVGTIVDRHLGDTHYAWLELITAARNDPGLAAAIDSHLNSSDRRMDRGWAAYLSSLSWPEEQLIALRHVTVACLRGLAVGKTLRDDHILHEDALSFFREMFLAFAGTKQTAPVAQANI